MMRAPAAVLVLPALFACALWRSDPEDAEASYAGALRVRPDPAVFEETAVGCRRTLTLELENADAAEALTVTSVASPGAALAVVGPLPLALPAGGRRLLDLQFAPDAPVDRSGAVTFATDETRAPGGALRRLPVTAVGVAPAASPAGPVAPAEPVDLVVVLDVSTTMGETAALREAVLELLPAEGDAGIRLGLVTFVNDVVAHRGGAFLDRAAFVEELDTQLRDEEPRVPDPDLPRHTLNFDPAENILDALHRAATAFAFREGARRVALLVTDATFLEPPAVYSGGTPALHSYAETADALAGREVRLFALHDGRKGGGLSSSFGGRPSLVARTAGAWFELVDLEAGTVTLHGILGGILSGSPCR